MESELMFLMLDTVETVKQDEDFYDYDGNHCKLLGLAEDAEGNTIGITVELLDRPDWTESPIQVFDWAAAESILGLTVLPYLA